MAQFSKRDVEIHRLFSGKKNYGCDQDVPYDEMREREIIMII